jgi:hypothetical protein
MSERLLKIDTNEIRSNVGKTEMFMVCYIILACDVGWMYEREVRVSLRLKVYF